MTSPAVVVGFLHEALGWIGIMLDIAGLVVCIFYLRLSTSMFLPVLAFAGFAGAAIASKVFTFAMQLNVLSPEVFSQLSVVLHVVNIAAAAALVVGLYAVLRDVRERFHFLREVREYPGERGASVP